MKLNILKYIALSLAASACSYEFPEPDASTIPSAGTADFTKTVAVGSSLTAGFMNGALYDAGQMNSFPAILATQFKLAGGGDFNQPDINAPDGYYGMAGDVILGRLYLKGSSPTPKIPGQAITAYAGDKSKLNNFSAYGVSIQTAQIPQLGGPSTGNPYFNPYYSRFASSPGTSTMTGDAANALENGGTFLIFWLGNDDVLGYATNGANQNDPTKPMTSEGAFSTAYTAAITSLLSANAEVKGVVANIPDVTSLPYFTTIPYKPVPLDQAKATQLTTDLANNYNAFLTGMVGATVITQEEANKRMLTFVAGANGAVIDDETLTDLDPYMAGPYAGLKPYRRARQTTAADLIVLPAASVIGTLVGGEPTKINGVTVPLSDTYILLSSEIMEVQSRIDTFNGFIADAVADNSSRLALVDVNEILAALKTSGATGITVNGLALTAAIVPPFGGFSLDGIHPNARGNAYLANKFIEVINEKFDANVPLSNPNNYPGNDLPVP
jgi:hypothetical protein